MSKERSTIPSLPNMRPLAVQCLTTKVLEIIFLDILKLGNVLNYLHLSQKGFVPGISCPMQINALLDDLNAIKYTPGTHGGVILFEFTQALIMLNMDH